ncbi:FecR domain-containing protein [Fulvivirgaceae bacterium BMA10]|uniref:FecR domain-containing protein n=1 Tax=Splendidivirga corallicola TaxID=3051826 RepID=A0ABT8KU98_9BACT|nr:FecR domain-containing protein [Fulvivirgaceae bacterium BMA10]
MDNVERLNTLFERFLNNQCSPEEVKELLSHIKEKPLSNELNPLMEDVWSKLETYPVLDNQHRQHLFEKIKNGTTKKRSKRIWVLPLKIAAAASVLIMVIILNVRRETETTEIPITVTKTTQSGQRASYILPDGSKVSLNAGSTITFPEKFSDDIRTVHLKGEAFFEVVKNSERPFIVESAQIKTRVLGTSFNIRAYQGQDIEVTVATGKVQVESLDRSASEDNKKVLLTANKQAVYSFESNRLIQTEVDIRKYLAWYSKELMMENVSVGDAFIMLEKRFDQKIILKNKRMSDCIIRKARYEKESLETILKGLQSFLDFEYEFNGYNQWIITGKGCK